MTAPDTEDERIYSAGVERAAARDDELAERTAIANELLNPYLAAWEREALEARLRLIEREQPGYDVVCSSGVMRRRCPELTPEAEKQLAAIDAELAKLHYSEQDKRAELRAKKLALFEGR